MALNRKVVHDLLDNRMLLVPDTDEDCQVHYAFFSRFDFTDVVVEEVGELDAILVGLETKGQVLNACRS